MSHAHHDHPHPFQPDLEDGPFTRHMALTDALADLLIAKGVCTAADIHRAVERMDAATPANGAKLIARAWTDPAFKDTPPV